MKIPKIIIVSGQSATGKTALAKTIAEHTHVPYFGKDEFKELLFDYLGWSDRDWSIKLGRTAFNLLFFVADKILAKDNNLILEANFRPTRDTEVIRNLVSKHNAKILEFHCFAPAEILAKKFNQRVAKGQRHLGHADTTITPDKLDGAEFQALGIGHVFEVDTEDFTKIDHDNLIKKASDFINSEAS